MNEIDDLLRYAEDEFERDGTLSCSTFSQLTQVGLDADKILEDFRG